MTDSPTPTNEPSVPMVTIRYLGSNPRTFGGRTVMGNKWSFDPTTQTTLTLREDEYHPFVQEGYWEVVMPENGGHTPDTVIEIPDEERPPSNESEAQHEEQTAVIPPPLQRRPKPK